MGRVKIDSTTFNRTFRKGSVLLTRRDPADMFCGYHRTPQRRLNHQQPRSNAPELAGMMAVPRGVIAAGMNKPLSCQHEFDRKSLFFDLLQKLRLMLSRIIAAQHHEELT